MDKYNHSEVESKWKEIWEKNPPYKAIDFDKQSLPLRGKKPKFYALVEFPYCSGEGLHMGHAFTNTMMDVVARKKRMEGFNVLHPMGWDSFGLPTENYAVKTGIQPAEITARNTKRFKETNQKLGISYDWDHEIDTSDPKYYRWTQWIFLQLYKKGLAYKAETPVGWCPSCKIILANEEIIDGKCERCGTEAEHRTQKQWILKITEYADRLADELDLVDYPSYVKKSQRDWIGRSEGAEVEFKVVCHSESKDEESSQEDPSTFAFAQCQDDTIKELVIFTTRPDTLYGATFMVIAPEHQLVDELVNPKSEIRNPKLAEINKYIETTKKKSERERIESVKDKTGVFSGLYAINPATKKEIPIWISDFVLATYGTGAIMAVPAHDERDWAFAKKFDLPIIPVIIPEGNPSPVSTGAETSFDKAPYIDIENGIMVNSPEWNDKKPSEAIKIAINWIEKQGIGKGAISYHLRDWIFSRQHYWGEPIPVIYCAHCAVTTGNSNIEYRNSKQKGFENLDLENSKIVSDFGFRASNLTVVRENGVDCAIVPVPEEDLPVELPKVEKYQPTETGESPLAKIDSWVNTTCPTCGSPARRETDTMPNWAGSNWYYLGYILANEIKNSKLETRNPKQIRNSNDQKSNTVSDFQNIFTINKNILDYWMPVDIYFGGAEHNTLHLLYSRFIYKFLNDIGVVPGKEPYASRRQHGVILGEDGFRMSKSRGNVLVPEDLIQAYGTDTVRIYLRFMGPYDSTMPWDSTGVEGCSRFLKRVWNLVLASQGSTLQTRQTSEALKRALNKTIKKVGEDIDVMKFNTAIASMMEFINVWKADEKELSKEDLKKFLIILAPFAPFITEELWQKLEVSQVSKVSREEKTRDTRGTRAIRDTFNSIHLQPWPEFDKNLIQDEEATIVVQVNGKVRAQLKVQSAKSNVQSLIEELAKKDERVLSFIDGKEIRKVIFVAGKLINFVV